MQGCGERPSPGSPASWLEELPSQALNPTTGASKAAKVQMITSCSV